MPIRPFTRPCWRRSGRFGLTFYLAGEQELTRRRLGQTCAPAAAGLPQARHRARPSAARRTHDSARLTTCHQSGSHRREQILASCHVILCNARPVTSLTGSHDSGRYGMVRIPGLRTRQQRRSARRRSTAAAAEPMERRTLLALIGVELYADASLTTPGLTGSYVNTVLNTVTS